MKDDTATLTSFGLNASSKIMLMGTKPNVIIICQSLPLIPADILFKHLSQTTIYFILVYLLFSSFTHHIYVLTRKLCPLTIHSVILTISQILHVQPQDLSQTTAGSAEEHALLSRISQSIDNTRSVLIPQIRSFEISVDSYLSSDTQDERALTKLTDTHHYLVETLMQALLALDGVVCPTEFETARKKRREAVKFTQDLIERVDAVKETLNVNGKGE
jgi:hypothetical protein